MCRCRGSLRRMIHVSAYGLKLHKQNSEEKSLLKQQHQPTIWCKKNIIRAKTILQNALDTFNFNDYNCFYNLVSFFHLCFLLSLVSIKLLIGYSIVFLFLGFFFDKKAVKVLSPLILMQLQFLWIYLWFCVHHGHIYVQLQPMQKIN